jgi:hypothetical protein
VLNALRAHGRYDGSYELIAKRIGQFVTPEAQPQALEQLFATVALCCAIENGDAHLKNFAVLYDDASSPVRLAPAYDLVSTTVYRARASTRGVDYHQGVHRNMWAPGAEVDSASSNTAARGRSSLAPARAALMSCRNSTVLLPTNT